MNFTPHTPEDKKRSYADVSSWNAARIIGEVFGWEHLTENDWKSLTQCPPQGFHPDRDSQSLRASIFNELKALWDQCDPSAHDFSSLRPGDTVNHDLCAFVQIICTRFKTHAGMKPDQDQHHYTVVSEVLKRLHTDPALRQKLETLRQIAGYAEGEMERYYADRINAKCEEDGFIGKHHLPQAASVSEKMQALKKILHPFPYPDNYEKIIEAETRLMKQPLDPAYFRIEDMDEEALRNGNGVIAARIASVKDKAAQLMQTLSGESSLTRHIASFEKKYITFPGSGSLPLSGIMLHITTGANINLIDIDPDAVQQSRRLITNLEKLGLVKPGGIKVIEGNITDMRYQKSNLERGHPTQTAGEIRALLDKDQTARFMTQKRKPARSNTARFDTLPKDDFEYVPHYSLPGKTTPYALSFTGYKHVRDANGERYTVSHQIYFDKEQGWKRSSDQRLIPSDIVFMASLIPEELKQQVVSRILEQTHVPDAVITRSVKGLAQLAYSPTDTNQLADTRAPFYGEAVSETHLVHQPVQTMESPLRGVTALMNPTLIVADGEVLNSTEIHYLPFHQALRGNSFKNVPDVLDRLSYMEQALAEANTKITRVQSLARLSGAPEAKQLATWAIKEMRGGQNDRAKRL